MKHEAFVYFDNVAKSFGDFVAVENVNFEIGKGEFLAIMGSSGCGKTTTLRMLAGLEDPSQGDIYLDGDRVNGKPTWERDTPMVWQSLALFPFLNVQENVEFSLKMRNVPKLERQQRARKWLDRLGILEFAERHISQLSGGQKQRVALARSLVTEPKILLLDEPLSALDAHLKVRMQSVLSGLQKDLGITFVYVTHSMSEAFSMADRVVIMSQGKIEQIGTPEEIYRKPHNRFVAEFLGSSNVFSGKIRSQSNDVLEVDSDEGQFSVKASDVKITKDGDFVAFTVNAENMNFSMTEEDVTGNFVRAKVVGEEFVGATATIFLETASGMELKVQKSHSELSKIDLKSNPDLYVFWQTENCHVLPGE